jgi:hypothetical protein
MSVTVSLRSENDRRYVCLIEEDEALDEITDLAIQAVTAGHLDDYVITDYDGANETQECLRYLRQLVAGETGG